jgi:hypothetical protein
MNKFHPIVQGEDIAAVDADEDSARYNELLFASCLHELYLNLLLFIREFIF